MTNGSEIAEYSDMILNCNFQTGSQIPIAWVFIPPNTNISNGIVIWSRYYGKKHPRGFQFHRRVKAINGTSIIIHGVLASDSGRYGCEEYRFWRTRMKTVLHVRVISKYKKVAISVLLFYCFGKN